MITQIRKVLLGIVFKILPPEFVVKVFNNRQMSMNHSQIDASSSSRISHLAEIHNLSGIKNMIQIDDNSVVDGHLLLFKSGGHIKVGKSCYVGRGARIWSAESVIIGNNVLISHNVNIVDTNSHELDYIKRAESFKQMLLTGHSKKKGDISTAPITIGDNVWINMNCIILKGVAIGKGAIIAAGSVVTKDVEAFTLVAGNPARFIKHISREDDQKTV